MIGMIIRVERKEVDYSKWLGSNYRTQAKKPQKCATLVSNHTGLSDAFVYLWALDGDLGFFAADFMKNIPIIRECIIASEGMFVPREGSDTEKQAFVELINSRQNDIE